MPGGIDRWRRADYPARVAGSAAVRMAGGWRVARWLCALALVALPAAAQESGWTLRLRALGSDYREQLGTSYFQSRNELELDGGFGFEVAGEYRFGSRSGIELAAGRLALDAEARVIQVEVVSFDPFVTRDVLVSTERGEIALQPFTVAYLFHPVRRGRIDLYFGPQLAYVTYDVGLDGASEREDELGYGAKLGLEWRPAGSAWSLGLELRHLEIGHETLDRDIYGDLGLTSYAVGVGYRFAARAGG